MSAMTDEAMNKLCDAMRSQYGAGVDFELALGDLVGKYRLAHERRMRDQQAADLLHKGWQPLAEQFGVCKATVYNMAARGRRKSLSDDIAA